MNDYILYILLACFINYFVIRVTFDFKKFVSKRINKIIADNIEAGINDAMRICELKQEKLIQDTFKLGYISLEKDLQQNFFAYIKNWISDNEKNNVAKNEEVQHNKQEQPPTADIWNNLDKLKELRDSISNGNQQDYKNVVELSDLPPLEAWRLVEAKIADKEMEQKNPTFINNQI